MKNKSRQNKLFKINRFSYIADEFDDGITALEIENILNEYECGHIFKQRAKWTVKEIKNDN